MQRCVAWLMFYILHLQEIVGIRLTRICALDTNYENVRNVQNVQACSNMSESQKVSAYEVFVIKINVSDIFSALGKYRKNNSKLEIATYEWDN